MMNLDVFLVNHHFMSYSGKKSQHLISVRNVQFTAIEGLKDAIV